MAHDVDAQPQLWTLGYLESSLSGLHRLALILSTLEGCFDTYTGAFAIPNWYFHEGSSQRRWPTGILRWVFPFPFYMFMDYFVLTLLRQAWNIIIIRPTHPMRTMFRKFQLHLTDCDHLEGGDLYWELRGCNAKAASHTRLEWQQLTIVQVTLCSPFINRHLWGLGFH